MPSVKQKRAGELCAFLGEIYKSAKMGADAVIRLLPFVKEDGLRSLMTTKLDGYERVAAHAASAIEALDGTPKEENILTRWSARITTGVSAMLDPTTGHIAELMIEGANMVITDMTKLLNAHAACADAEPALRLARELVAFEEHNLSLLRHYL